jgi:hypothetical protein
LFSFQIYLFYFQRHAVKLPLFIDPGYSLHGVFLFLKEDRMSMYNAYPLHQILLRRGAVILVGLLALPVMLFRKDRARFYSYLHRVWAKTSDKPVWLAHSESAIQDFY